MKARLRIAVFAALIVLLGGMAWSVRRVVMTNAELKLAHKVLEMVPEAAQRIQDFHRVQVGDDGRKEWEIAAAEARYFDQEQRVVVREPMLRLFLEDGRTVGVRGKEGIVSLDGKELRAVDLNGEIEVTLADYMVRTEAAHYDRVADTITAAGGVELSGADVDARGMGMEVEIGPQKVHLLRDVQMVFRPVGTDEDGA